MNEYPNAAAIIIVLLVVNFLWSVVSFFALMGWSRQRVKGRNMAMYDPLESARCGRPVYRTNDYTNPH